MGPRCPFGPESAAVWRLAVLVLGTCSDVQVGSGGMCVEATMF